MTPRKSAIMLILFVALAAGRSHGQQSGVQPPPGVGIDQRMGAQIPVDVTLQDESGRPINMSELVDGKPTILTLVYYECPMLCGQVLNGLLTTLDKLSMSAGHEFRIVTLSIDPHETPELASRKKETFLERYDREGARDGWRFLTGDQDAIRSIADAVGFRYKYDPATRQFAHAAGIMVLAPGGKVARYYFGIEYPVTDLRLGLVEASAGKIGSTVDQLLLLCFHYDPTRGRYGFVIMSALRAAGIVTVLAVAVSIIIMLRRDRHAHRRPAGSNENEQGEASDA